MRRSARGGPARRRLSGMNNRCAASGCRAPILCSGRFVAATYTRVVDSTPGQLPGDARSEARPPRGSVRDPLQQPPSEDMSGVRRGAELAVVLLALDSPED